MPSSARPPGSTGGSWTAEQAASCLESILSGSVAAVGSKPPTETRQAQHTSGQEDVSCSFESLQIRERRKFLRNTVRRSLSVLYLTLHRGLFQAWPSGGTVSVATVWIAPQRLDLTCPVPRICWGPAAGPAPPPWEPPWGQQENKPSWNRAGEAPAGSLPEKPLTPLRELETGDVQQQN